jgi:phosphate transport system permease protein
LPVLDNLSTRWYPTRITACRHLPAHRHDRRGAHLHPDRCSRQFHCRIAPRWLREIQALVEILGPSVAGLFARRHVGGCAPDAGPADRLTAFTGSLIRLISRRRSSRRRRARRRAEELSALALGATKWQTIWMVTVKAGKSGILTAMMLGIGRAIGETMAVMMVTGNAARMPLSLDSLFLPVRTMTATIAAEMGEVAQGSTHFHVLFAIGMYCLSSLSHQPGRLAGDLPQTRRSARLLS